MSARTVIAEEYRARPWLWRIAFACACASIGQFLAGVL